MLVAFVLGWLVAQLSKVMIGVLSGDLRGRKMKVGELIDYFTQSGGMPSGHTASFTAATVFLGLTVGFGSELFALAVCVWIVIVYDAIHVRYAVGEQGKALNKLLKAAGKPELTVVEGHTIWQVVVGALVGVVMGVLVFMIIGQ